MYVFEGVKHGRRCHPPNFPSQCKQVLFSKMGVNMNVGLTKRLSLRSAKPLYRVGTEQGPQVVERHY